MKSTMSKSAQAFDGHELEPGGICHGRPETAVFTEKPQGGRKVNSGRACPKTPRREADSASSCATEGFLQPKIRVRWTDFTYPKAGAEHHQEMLVALTQDQARSDLIAGDVKNELARGAGACLVVSDRTAHLEALRDALALRRLEMTLLTGKTPLAQREAIEARIQAGEVRILGSTAQLIGEGFDCPGLSSLFLAAPIKLHGRLLQVVGMILKQRTGKAPLFYDYKDPIDTLMAASRARVEAYGRYTRKVFGEKKFHSIFDNGPDAQSNTKIKHQHTEIQMKDKAVVQINEEESSSEPQLMEDPIFARCRREEQAERARLEAIIKNATDKINAAISGPEAEAKKNLQAKTEKLEALKARLEALPKEIEKLDAEEERLNAEFEPAVESGSGLTELTKELSAIRAKKGELEVMLEVLTDKIIPKAEEARTDAKKALADTVAKIIDTILEEKRLEALNTAQSVNDELKGFRYVLNDIWERLKLDPYPRLSTVSFKIEKKHL